MVKTKKEKKKKTSYVYVIMIVLASVVACLFLFIFMINYFTTKIVYDTDLEKKYRDYWNYSLGEYKFDYHDETETSGDTVKITKTITRYYKFYYNDINGNGNVLEVSSYNFNNKLEENIEKELEKKVDEKLSFKFEK